MEAVLWLLIVVGAGFACVVNFVLKSRRKDKGGSIPQSKKKSPFRLDNLACPGPLITDQKQRDAVLKQGFSSKKVPDELDAVIIGSGIGSLSAAALLSRAGWKVLVLEQHDQAGGCCHTFEEKGFEFDVGIHYIGKVLGGTEFRAYIDQITNGKLDWQKIDDHFDTVCFQNDGKNIERYEIHAGKEPFQRKLIEHFPEEETNIRKFVEKLDGSRKQSLGMTIVKTIPIWLSNLVCKSGLVHTFTSFFKDSEISLQEVVEASTPNKKLQAVLSYCFGDYGVLPSDAPWTMHSMLLTHFWSGAAYPVGGGSEIPFQIIPVVEASGGKVLVRAPVSRILLNQEGEACGVAVSKGGTEQEIRARVVVSGAGLINTFANMLPREIASKSRYFKYIEKVGNGHAAIQLFVGLRGSSKELELPKRNFWCFTDENLDANAKKYLELPAEDAEETDTPLLFVSFPSTKDPTWNQRYPGKSVATIVTFTNYEWFRDWESEKVKKRGDSYDGFKSLIQDRIWRQCLIYFPQLEDRVEYMSLGSPLSHQFYIGSPKGEIYGLDHGRKRFTPECVTELRPQTDIPNLYLTGQDILGCGFSGASYGGLLCASALLGRNLFLELVALNKKKKKLQKSKCV